MIFEKKSLRVIVPLDIAKGSCYMEPVHNYESDDDLDYIYKIIARDRDSVNLTVGGWITWDHESYCTLDLDE